MVKGVTKRVVEIKETGSSYFERAIFFVNMEACRGAGGSTLSQEARRIIDRYSNDKGLEAGKESGKKHVRLKSILKFAASAAAGALMMFLIIKIF